MPWEINGDLYGHDGIKNIDLFTHVLLQVKNLFDTTFGSELIDEIFLFVDNATSDSGYVPITKTLFKKVVVIKLGIRPNSQASQIAFQFSHELMHVVFRAVKGLAKPAANYTEEAICTAASLITLKELYPDDLNLYMRYLKTRDDKKYRDGVQVASDVNFNLKDLMPLVEKCTY